MLTSAYFQIATQAHAPMDIASHHILITTMLCQSVLVGTTRTTSGLWQIIRNPCGRKASMLCDCAVGTRALCTRAVGTRAVGTRAVGTRWGYARLVTRAEVTPAVGTRAVGILCLVYTAGILLVYCWCALRAQHTYLERLQLGDNVFGVIPTG